MGLPAGASAPPRLRPLSISPTLATLATLLLYLIHLPSFVQAVFGVRISLRSVELQPDAVLPPELEGATWRFAWRGEAVCVSVVGGRSVRC